MPPSMINLLQEIINTFDALNKYTQIDKSRLPPHRKVNNN